MNKVVLTGKIAAMPSKEAFDAADDQGVRFDLVIVSQWQNSEEVHHEWFACVVHGKQPKGKDFVPQKAWWIPFKF